MAGYLAPASKNLAKGGEIEFWGFWQNEVYPSTESVLSSFFPTSHDHLCLLLFLQGCSFLTNNYEWFHCLTIYWWQIYSFIPPVPESWRVDGRKGRSWDQEFKARFHVTGLLFKFITREQYFKLQKTSRTFPEFLRRRRSIDQNNQEKPTSLLNAAWVFYLSKQKANGIIPTSWSKGEVCSLWKHLQFAAGNEREGDILLPVSRPGHRDVGSTCLLHGFVNEQLPQCTE